MKRLGKQTLLFDHSVFVEETGTVVGLEEFKGPLGKTFDFHVEDAYAGEKTWERAEQYFMKKAIDFCLKKSGKSSSDIDFFLAGDLINQLGTSNYVAREIPASYLGLYSACATSMAMVTIGACFIDSGIANHVLTAVSSHHATAERQFRFPTELGIQKPKTAQYTVTGGAAAMISSAPSRIQITHATVGKVIDKGISSGLDMGSAMAPAAVDTVCQHLSDTNRTLRDYDYIVTGDLASVGSIIFQDLLFKKGLDASNCHIDCGLLIYRPDDVYFAGGSGCACSAVVTFSHLFNEIKKGTFKRLLIVATGALLNPLMLKQGETIPVIAHGVVFERNEGIA